MREVVAAKKLMAADELLQQGAMLGAVAAVARAGDYS